ncbi:MAG: glycoside hydrolase family 5 protein, partial [Syntrophothermus sp.]
GGHFSVTLPVKHRSEFTGGNISQYPGRLEAHGSQLVDANGEVVLLKGLMPPDPARLRSDGDFGQKLIAEMAGTGANVIRIPVHPENWVRDPDYLWRYLDPIVAWAGEADLYVIVDWHYIGNVASGAGPQMPDLEEKPMDLTLAFWRSTARYFRETPNVIFEIFNEPQSIAAAEWHSSATAIVRAIREQGADQLVIVGGLEYGKDLSWVLEHPIEDDNIAYASHVYPAHSHSSWPHWFGEVSGRYPVVITEWGFMDDNGDAAQSYLVGDPATYGDPFLSYLRDHQIGWVACWYDDQWLPAMFTDGRQGYTRYGEFVLQQLQEEK